MGQVLFLLGIFVMMTGEWPSQALPDTPWALPLRLLAWPWLYLALVAASFVFLALHGTLRPARQTTVDFLRPYINALAAGFLLSVIFSLVPSLSWLAFGAFLTIVGFALAAAQIVEEERWLAATSVAMAAAALLLALRVIIWRFDEGLTSGAFHIGNTAWLGKLQIAWVLNLLAPLLLARFLQERAVAASALHGAAWLVSGAAIHLLFSRAGSVAFVLTTVALCAFNPHYWRRWAILLAIFTGLTLVLVARSPDMSGHVATSLVRVDQDTGMRIRQEVWRETLRMIGDHPLTGIGLGTYDDVAYTQYRPQGDRHFFRNGWHAHNVFLHILAETGLIGFLAWCCLWYSIARFLLRQWRTGDPVARLNSTAALCFILAFFVVSQTENLIAARVHAGFRMNLVLVLLVVYGMRQAYSRPSAALDVR